MKYKAILENSIMQKNIPATAGSKMLADFISPIDATVVTKLQVAGVDIIGRFDTSEFGVSGLFPDDAPKREEGIASLSEGALLTNSINSSENVSFVAETSEKFKIDKIADHQNKSSDLCMINTISSNKADFALCNDYTGSIARTAASSGLYYIHPTYGTISRYGLIQSVTSMDQIGILCKSPEIGFQALKIISENPCHSAKNPEPVFRGDSKIPTTCFTPCFPCLSVMQILCCAELSNNISRYDGIKFGYRPKEYTGLNELYTKSRTESFGEDVKLAAIIGAMVLYQEDQKERYYDKAMKMRRLIRNSFEFNKYDVITTCCPTLSRLCGFPALTTSKCTYIAGPNREDILMSLV